MRDINLIFLHGWLFDSRIWNGLDKLFVDFNTQKCDLPGYGKNYSSRLSHDEYCFDLLSEAKKPLVVIAWSYGGILALNHFIAYNTIEKLILINTNLNIKNNKNIFLNTESIEKLKISLLKNKSMAIKRFIYECTKNSKYRKTNYKKIVTEFDICSLPDTRTLLENLDFIKKNKKLDLSQEKNKNILYIDTDKENFTNHKDALSFEKKVYIDNLGHIPFINGNKSIYKSIINFIQ